MGALLYGLPAVRALGVATMENENSVASRHRFATQVLSYLAAALCGIFLLVVGAFWTVSSGTVIYKTLAEPDAAGAQLQGELVVTVLVGSLIALVPGVAFGRFLLRALPPQFSDHTRRTWPRTVGTIALFAVFIGPFILAVIELAVIEISVANAEKVQTWSIDAVGKNLGPSALLALLWASGAMGPLILRHRKPRGFLDRPFVLFLRRFSTFSDRTVIALVLKQATPGVPVVFLTPTSSQPRDWDPFVVGFAGLKLLHPWLSVPIVLRARDDNWQRAAGELIARAQTILLDTSKKSPAVQTEVEMIEKASRGPDTVLLGLLDAGPCKYQFGNLRGARTIGYKKSWMRALPRIMIGLVPMALVALLLSILVVSQLMFICIGIATASAYFLVCVRPTINREAKVALRAVLHR